MNNEDRQDRIDEYLQGKSADAAAFERDLQEDSKLNEEMEATRMALDAIAVGGDHTMKERLRKLEAGMAAETGTTTSQNASARIVQLKPRKRNNWMRIAAVAAVVLFIAGYFILRPAGPEGPQLAMESFTAYDNIEYTITKSGGTTDPRATAYAAYEAGDYAAAERAFTPLQSELPADAFYLGQSRLAQQKYEAALPVFTQLAALADFGLSGEANYYRALSLVGLNRSEEARLLLEEIVVDANHPSYNEAEALLSRL